MDTAATSWNLQGAQVLNWENALAEARWGRGVGDLEEGAIRRRTASS